MSAWQVSDNHGLGDRGLEIMATKAINYHPTEAIHDCCYRKHLNGMYRRDAELPGLCLQLAQVRFLVTVNPADRADRLTRAADRLRAYILRQPNGRALIARSESNPGEIQ